MSTDLSHLPSPPLFEGELAWELQISERAVRDRRNANWLPKPYHDNGRYRIWAWEAVQEWQRTSPFASRRKAMAQAKKCMGLE